VATKTDRFVFRRKRVQTSMIILGLIFLLLGAVLAIPILWTIGIILVVVGLVLMLLGRSGHQVGSRAHYW
jgi:fatty acid desaturase